MHVSRAATVIALAIGPAFAASCSVADLTSGDGTDGATFDSTAEPSDAVAEQAPKSDGAIDAGPDAVLLPGDGDAGDATDSASTGCLGAYTPPSGAVLIEDQGNLRYLEVPLVPSDAGAWGTIIDTSSLTRASNQFWTFQPIGDDSGTYRIVNQNSGDCIDVVGGFTNNGVGLQQYGCFSQDNQHFWVYACPGGTVQIVGQQAVKCLTSVANTDNAGTYLWTCSSDPSQRWSLAQ
jgi:hypothetical protein